MPSLTLKNVPDPISDYQVVDVSQWFGCDEKTGEPFTVNVYPMTVRAKSVLGQYCNDMATVKDKDGKDVPVSIPNKQHDPASVITAMCCYDDAGNLAFGVDHADAISRVEGLASDPYRSMVLHLSSVALSVTAGSVNSENEVKAAAKN